MRTFLDLLVRCMDPDPDPSTIKQKLYKKLDSYCIVTNFIFYKKNSFSLASSRSMTKLAGARPESGSISQRHGSADPDPHQNVMDPQH
jgi:hypothetical protein